MPYLVLFAVVPSGTVLIAAVPASTVIMILVQVGKRLGIPSAWAPVVAIVLGVSYTSFAYLAQFYPGLIGWGQALGAGMTIGLTACGLYSGSKAMFTRALPGMVRGRVSASPVVTDGAIRLGAGTSGKDRMDGTP